MKILIIEDDKFKAINLKKFFVGFFENSELILASSLVEAVDAINESSFDLIVVDMAIPSHPIVKGGGSPNSLLNGGIDVLMKLRFKKRSDPCVVVTQFHDIKISGDFYELSDAADIFNESLGCNVLSCIEYKEGDDKWEKEMKMVLDSL